VQEKLKYSYGLEIFYFVKLISKICPTIITLFSQISRMRGFHRRVIDYKITKTTFKVLANIILTLVRATA
jgi:hypothetical protein